MNQYTNILKAVDSWHPVKPHKVGYVIDFTKTDTEAGKHMEINRRLNDSGFDTMVKVITGRSKFNKGLKYGKILIKTA